MSSAVEDNSNTTTKRKLPLGKYALIAAMLVALASAATSSVIIVDETQAVLVERLGEIVTVYDQPEDRGLHFKLPWPIDSVRSFDRRVHLFDPPGREIFTGDQRNITIDAYVCWRVSQSEEPSGGDLLDRPVVRFFRGLGDREIAEARLESRVQSILTKHIGEESFASLLSVTNSEAGPDASQRGLLDVIADRIRDDLVKRSDESQSIGERWGIEIVDFRIKRINLPVGNQPAVFERMRSERRRIADGYRSEGMAENTKIKGRAKREYDEIIARARSESERIRGQAEADAFAILNKAHAMDPEFYRVIKTLDTYRSIINDKTTLVLSTSGKLFRLLVDGVDESTELQPPNINPATPTKRDEENGEAKEAIESTETQP